MGRVLHGTFHQVWARFNYSQTFQEEELPQRFAASGSGSGRQLKSQGKQPLRRGFYSEIKRSGKTKCSISK